MDELMAPIEGILNEIKSKWKEASQQEPFLDSVKAFAHAVDWKVRCSQSVRCPARCTELLANAIPIQEPWLVGLVTAQLLVLVLVLVMRKNQTGQAVVFAFSGTGVSDHCALQRG
jgi:hypothetical protein